MDNEKLNETILSFRKFLHDMANKLVVSQGMTSAVQMQMEMKGELDEKGLERLKKAVNAMDDMTDMIRAERETLIGIQKTLGIPD